MLGIIGAMEATSMTSTRSIDSFFMSVISFLRYRKTRGTVTSRLKRASSRCSRRPERISDDSYLLYHMFLREKQDYLKPMMVKKCT